jgi:hypothetical protein
MQADVRKASQELKAYLAERKAHREAPARKDHLH